MADELNKDVIEGRLHVCGLESEGGVSESV